MYGVVLWSDLRKQRALIWCEDHGNLAYVKGGLSSKLEELCIDSGDLVSFDVSVEDGLRLAINICLVASEEFPTLADGLREAVPATAVPREEGQSCKVVALHPNLPDLRQAAGGTRGEARKQA